LIVVALPARAVLAAPIVSDGFGDGDRDNTGLDTGATATDATDIGIPWLLTDGTSAVNFLAVNDAAGIGSGNALQLNNTGSNNRPALGHFAPVTLNDGDKLVLRFDARLVSTSVAADRAVRFGLYHDTNADDGTVDHGSTGSVSVDDVGYNARLDAGPEAANTTTMDVTRDDTATGTSILQATATSLGISSTNTADQLSTSDLKNHFELTLLRSGASLLVTLQKDSNAAITGTDTTPTGFIFDEVALGVRSSAAMDMRFDNIQVEYTAGVPEPVGIATIGMIGACLLGRRRSRA